MDNKLYRDEVLCRTNSAISGEHEEEKPYTDPIFSAIKILSAWLEDDDIQEITVCSTNIGFVKTFRKQFRPRMP